MINRTLFAPPAYPERMLPTLNLRNNLFLQNLANIIYCNISNAAFSVQSLADQAYLSVSQLNRKLNALIGKPAGKLIREIRLQYAAKLLTDNSVTISEIAYQTGFSDQAHFCRSFKNFFLCTPTTYRKGVEKFFTPPFINIVWHRK